MQLHHSPFPVFSPTPFMFPLHSISSVWPSIRVEVLKNDDLKKKLQFVLQFLFI